ncbi:BZ3500_MvSof-1268-A1-R1_Chr2-2g04876 [Microbotryum saponariae]|uniref:BZ3500_MvSof-1268-A1-R1_Chr2-2g04876 protein n=1 Tax=Microbotryum saponariae TaxID=289078 RepID=A0A2X0LZV1_9BASI|nr:BZ3500_MvSof-1268-A1-R1_Chr2-2g04876 [Microbotryum saponariae]SDA00381.1 BZ3501_MvSof-1269-A2-R1_Chr2-2g04550 [Microbotryum saponariae]
MSEVIAEVLENVSTDTTTQSQDALVIVPQSSTPVDPTSTSSSQTKSGSSSSVLAALTRALFLSLAFLFKRPIRLFRPVKISTWTGLQAIAHEHGHSKVTPAFVRSLIRKQGWSFIPRHLVPPVLVNGLIGLTLFGVYTVSRQVRQGALHQMTPRFGWSSHQSSESYLNSHLPPDVLSHPSTQVLIPFISGTLAGASQSIISAPLDNARLLLLRRQHHLRLYGHRTSRNQPGRPNSKPFVSWWPLLRDAVFLNTGSTEKLSNAQKVRRGYTLWVLTLIKDGLGFGAFFATFEVGRSVSRRMGLAWDGIQEGDQVEENDWDEEKNQVVPTPTPSNDPAVKKKRRSAASLLLQSLGILTAGGVAGLCFALVARPFDRMRMVIYEGRMKALEREERVKQEIERRGEGNGNGNSSPVKKGTSKARAPCSSRGNQKEHIRTLRARGRSRLSSLSAKAFLARPFEPKPKPISASSFPNPASAKLHPNPSAFHLVSEAARQAGPINFFFGSTASLGSSTSNRATGTGPRLPSGMKGRHFGPTRLSARARDAKAKMVHGAERGLLARATRVLAYVPAYSVAFFAYALMSGDLR